MPLQEISLKEVCRNVETSLQNFKRCDEVLARKGEAQDPMIIPFVFRLEGAYLRLKESVVPRDCVVKRGALLPPTPGVVSGGSQVASRVLAEVLQSGIRLA